MPEVVSLCQQILTEEERMAEWLGTQIHSITNRYMDKAGDEKAA